MIDPNNVLLRCPNGHELQAARTDLDKDLACPVCNMTFRPQVSTGGAPPPPDFRMGTDKLGGSATEAIARFGRAKHPAYTVWMLAAWLITSGFLTANMGLNLLNPSLSSSSSLATISAPVKMLILGVICLVCVSMPIACVLQLIWNYRIHADARRFGQYSDIAPGLALGLAFIPFLNVPWTAFSMVRLAMFAAKGQGSENVKATSAVHFAKLNFIIAIVATVSCCTTTGLLSASLMPIVNEAQQNNVSPTDPDFQRRMQDVSDSYTVMVFASMLIILAGTIVYALAVRRLETSLYDRLGALPK